MFLFTSRLSQLPGLSLVWFQAHGFGHKVSGFSLHTAHDGVVTTAMEEQPGIGAAVDVIVSDDYVVAPFGSNDAVVAVAPHLVVDDVQIVTVVVRIKAVLDIVVHLVSSPVTLLVPCRGPHIGEAR